MKNEVNIIIDHFSKMMEEMGFTVKNQPPHSPSWNIIKEITLSRDEQNIIGQLFIRPRDGALIVQTDGYAREIQLSDPNSFQEIEKSLRKVLEILLLRSLNSPPWKR